MVYMVKVGFVRETGHFRRKAEMLDVTNAIICTSYLADSTMVKVFDDKTKAESYTAYINSNRRLVHTDAARLVLEENLSHYKKVYESILSNS